MRPHGEPDFEYSFDLAVELQHIRDHQVHRSIPAKSDSNLLIATWNLTNFGLQKRRSKHLKIMAEIIKPFDVVAIQEVADNLKHLERLTSYLGKDWDAIYTDIAGNRERLGYLFDTKRLVPTGLAAELAMRGYERKEIKIEVGDVTAEEEFEGFNRNPYMVSFLADEFDFTLVNVHLYWTVFMVRLLETQALAEWARKRVKKPSPPHDDIILIGDFNMPKAKKGDPIHDTLVKQGLQIPKYGTNIVGSNLAGDRDYDELAFFPRRTKEDFTGRMGVFDFDKALFPDLWSYTEPDAGLYEQKKRFFQYIRYFISDHRLVYAEFRRKSTQ